MFHPTRLVFVGLLLLSTAAFAGDPGERSQEADRTAEEIARLQEEMNALEQEREELLKRLAAAEQDISRGKMPGGEKTPPQSAPARAPATAKAWLDGLAAAKGLGRREALQRIGRVQVFHSTPNVVRDIFPEADENTLIRRGLRDLGLLHSSDAPASLYLDLRTGSFLFTSEKNGQRDEHTVVQLRATATLQAPMTVLREGRFYRTSGVIASATTARVDVEKIAPATVSEVIAEALRLVGQDLESNRGPIRPDSEWQELFAGQNDASALYQGFRDSAGVTANGSQASLAGVEHLGALGTGLSPYNHYQPLQVVLGEFNPLPDHPLVGMILKLTEWDPAEEWRTSLSRLGLSVDTGRGAKSRPALLFGLSGTASAGAGTTLASIIGQASLLEPECVADTPGGAIRFVCKTWDHVEVGLALADGSSDRSDTVAGAARKVNQMAVGVFEEAYRQEAAEARLRGIGTTAALVPLLPMGPVDPRLGVALDPKIAAFTVGGTAYGVSAVVDAYLRMNEGEQYQYAVAFRDGNGSLFIAGIDREENLFRIYPLPMSEIRAELDAAGVSFFPAADTSLSQALEIKYPGYRLVSRSYSVTFKSLFSSIGKDGSYARTLGDLLAPPPPRPPAQSEPPATSASATSEDAVNERPRTRPETSLPSQRRDAALDRARSAQTTTDPLGPVAAPPSSSPESEVPLEPEDVAEPVPDIDRWEEAASKAARTMDLPSVLRFDIEPEDAILRTWARGDERGIVQGMASNFHPRSGEQSLRLSAGEYLITVIHSGYPDYIIRARIGGAATQPQVVRVDLSRR